jgi:hypothetical protein
MLQVAGHVMQTWSPARVGLSGCPSSSMDRQRRGRPTQRVHKLVCTVVIHCPTLILCPNSKPTRVPSGYGSKNEGKRTKYVLYITRVYLARCCCGLWSSWSEIEITFATNSTSLLPRSSIPPISNLQFSLITALHSHSVEHHIKIVSSVSILMVRPEHFLKVPQSVTCH